MVPRLDAKNDADCDRLIGEASAKERRVFDGRPPREQRAIYRVLFPMMPRALPPRLAGARVIGLYNPMADRSNGFPDGLRWCVNVYTGCKHDCAYCYVTGYSRNGIGVSPKAKKDYARTLDRDVARLVELGVPAAPIHLSNSTDPLQEDLERTHRHTALTLEAIARHRDRFTSVVLLTKNPALLLEGRYLELLLSGELEPFTLQVSCGFWDDGVRAFFEPAAPPAAERRVATEFLAAHGVDTELRIDPLFPNSGIGATQDCHAPLDTYGLPEALPPDAQGKLVQWAADAGVRAVVAKPLKVPVSARARRCKQLFGQLYKDTNGGAKGVVQGGSWRLPRAYQRALIREMEIRCDAAGIAFRHCLHDVLHRR